MDSEPAMEKLSKTIDAVACSKSSGEDSIPPVIIKCGKPPLLKPLHIFLSFCWKEVKVR